jgi:hypothetical protein
MVPLCDLSFGTRDEPLLRSRRERGPGSARKPHSSTNDLDDLVLMAQPVAAEPARARWFASV